MSTLPLKFPSLSLTETFQPKLISTFREGYGLTHLRADVMAGLTVAVVALPLSMAIAIGSGLSPERGLYSAVVGGFLISALGGSRYQVGGPAGAFMVLVASTASTHGIDGLICATALSGVFLSILGALRLGNYIKFVPFPVTVGFTTGIAAIIFVSQIPDFLGIAEWVAADGKIFERLHQTVLALPLMSFDDIAVATVTLAIIVIGQYLVPKAPNLLLAIFFAGLWVYIGDLPIDTINSRFGGIPSALPNISLAPLSWQMAWNVLPDAVAFTLLGAIESLLSASVADSMTGRHHRSNMELVAQGIANIVAALFGGFCVTGTIARTATNVRAGAHSPVAGMVHALAILMVILVASPLAGYIPLSALAALLIFVAWNMAEKHAFWLLLKISRADGLIVSSTFGVTLVWGLAEGIIVGFALGALIFIDRMAKAVNIDHLSFQEIADRSEYLANDLNPSQDPSDDHSNMLIYKLSGAFFFGAAHLFAQVSEQLKPHHRAVIFDLSEVPFIDSSGAHMLIQLMTKARKWQVKFWIVGARTLVKHNLQQSGLTGDGVVFAENQHEVVDRYSVPRL